MKQILLVATLALVLWGMPALAGPPSDFDSDGVIDTADNCSEAVNPDQDDTDGDNCGNLCDADYDNNGFPGFPDFAAFTTAFGSNDEEKVHTEPVAGGIVGFPEFAFFTLNFGIAPGPSGTTPGTTACP